ncbi:MAG: hypothetical protein ACLPKB_35025 [Xanthobacteraceae bacterium]
MKLCPLMGYQPSLLLNILAKVPVGGFKGSPSLVAKVTDQIATTT